NSPKNDFTLKVPTMEGIHLLYLEINKIFSLSCQPICNSAVDDTLLQYLSPLGWEHINLTGDYLWRSKAKIGGGKFRPLRAIEKP
ncbi:Tn3 family transposase, partial [Acinetobacter baumannii]